MTVRDAVRVLPEDADIKIAYSGLAYDIPRGDPLLLEAYGDFVIDRIEAFAMGKDRIDYELVIALRPVKA